MQSITSIADLPGTSCTYGRMREEDPEEAGQRSRLRTWRATDGAGKEASGSGSSLTFFWRSRGCSAPQIALCGGRHAGGHVQVTFGRGV